MTTQSIVSKPKGIFFSKPLPWSNSKANTNDTALIRRAIKRKYSPWTNSEITKKYVQNHFRSKQLLCKRIY